MMSFFGCHFRLSLLNLQGWTNGHIGHRVALLETYQTYIYKQFLKQLTEVLINFDKVFGNNDKYFEKLFSCQGLKLHLKQIDIWTLK